jgi:hypothetical protein
MSHENRRSIMRLNKRSIMKKKCKHDYEVDPVDSNMRKCGKCDQGQVYTWSSAKWDEGDGKEWVDLVILEEWESERN